MSTASSRTTAQPCLNLPPHLDHHRWSHRAIRCPCGHGWKCRSAFSPVHPSRQQRCPLRPHRYPRDRHLLRQPAQPHRQQPGLPGDCHHHSPLTGEFSSNRGRSCSVKVVSGKVQGLSHTPYEFPTPHVDRRPDCPLHHRLPSLEVRAPKPDFQPRWPPRHAPLESNSTRPKPIIGINRVNDR